MTTPDVLRRLYVVPVRSVPARRLDTAEDVERPVVGRVVQGGVDLSHQGQAPATDTAAGSYAAVGTTPVLECHRM